MKYSLKWNHHRGAIFNEESSSARWHYWSRMKAASFCFEEKIGCLKSKQAAFHPGPVLPPSGEGSTWKADWVNNIIPAPSLNFIEFIQHETGDHLEALNIDCVGLNIGIFHHKYSFVGMTLIKPFAFKLCVSLVETISSSSWLASPFNISCAMLHF